MKLYPKIQSPFYREEKKPRRFIMDKWSMPEFALLQNINWFWDEKLDGTNVRIMWDGQNVAFGGRTDNAQMPVPLSNYLHSHFTKERLASALIGPTVLYGEGVGKGIQKGTVYGEEQHFALFDALFMPPKGPIWGEVSGVIELAEKLHCMRTPLHDFGSIWKAVEYVKSSPKSKYANRDFVLEGLVLRPTTTLLTRQGERIITKIKVKDFY